MPAGSTSIEGVERTNAVVISNPLQRQGDRGEMKRDPNTIEVNSGRNCYNYRGFGYITQNCRNQGIID